MRRFAIWAVAATLLVALGGHNGARAQTTTATGTATSSSSSNSGAIAVGGGGGSASATGGNARLRASQSQMINFNTPAQTQSTVNYRQSGSVRTTVAAVAPGLAAAGIESCNSSLSGGIGATGWGVSFGGPIMDQECNLRLWARTTWAMGQRNLTAAIIAQSPTVQRAMQSLDQQGLGGGAPGAVSFNTGYGAPGTASRARMYGGCKRWSGGAQGVGSCVVPE